MKHLLPYFRKYRKESLLAPLFKMLEACFDLAVPLIVADMINVGIAAGDARYLFLRFGLLLAMALLGLSCSFTAQYFAARAAIGTAGGLRHDLLEKIQSLSFTELDKLGSSTLITRITSDINQVQNGLNMFLRLFLRSPFIVFGAMLLSFTIDSRLALILVAAIVLLFLIVFGVMRLTSPLYQAVQKKLDGVTGATRENLSGVRVIRAFGREETQIRQFRRANEALLSGQLRVGWLSALMNPLTYVVVNAAVIAVLWVGGGRVNGGLLLSGDIIALINYITQILVELVKLANLIALLSRAAASMNRVGQVLDTESSMDFSGHETEFSSADEAVAFRNVSLRYAGAGAESLSDISFTALRGQTIGVIGGTGSGKSSLIHLIPRFYDATGGTVFLGGRPIGEWDREALQKAVAIVDQNPLLFTGTIRSNLLMGDGDATEERLWQALETAQAAEFVRKKPGGLDAPVEQGGGNFSGGQKQRLTIARALAANARVLILDDSSSALDYATDAALRKALKKLPRELTVFIVSQRTSSIAHADQILVLDDGKLVGAGAHKALLETCGVYREIYDSQFRKEAQV